MTVAIRGWPPTRTLGGATLTQLSAAFLEIASHREQPEYEGILDSLCHHIPPSGDRPYRRREWHVARVACDSPVFPFLYLQPDGPALCKAYRGNDWRHHSGPSKGVCVGAAAASVNFSTDQSDAGFGKAELIEHRGGVPSVFMSTLLNMIAGLKPPFCGNIAIKHQMINDVLASKCNIVVLRQAFALIRNMTDDQNMTFGLKNRGLAIPDRDKTFADLAVHMHKVVISAPSPEGRIAT